MPRRPTHATLALLSVVALVSSLGACSSDSATPTSTTTAATPTSAAPSASATTPRATSTAAPSSEPAQASVAGTCQRSLAAYPLLQPGSTGAAVRALQCFLNDADYGPVLVDGIYGKQTRAAVTRVEQGFEGPAPHPGRIDDGMWVLLISRSLGTETLKVGSSGADVTTLQRALRAAGGRLVVDGSFGTQTATVVRQFQRSNTITVDGIVGDETSFFLKSGGVIAPH